MNDVVVLVSGERTDEFGKFCSSIATVAESGDLRYLASVCDDKLSVCDRIKTRLTRLGQLVEYVLKLEEGTYWYGVADNDITFHIGDENINDEHKENSKGGYIYCLQDTITKYCLEPELKKTEKESEV